MLWQVMLSKVRMTKNMTFVQSLQTGAMVVTTHNLDVQFVFEEHTGVACVDSIPRMHTENAS